MSKNDNLQLTTKKSMDDLEILEINTIAISSKLKEARIYKGYKQEELGKLVGVKGNTISGYENGVSEPNLQILRKLINILSLDANWLFNSNPNSTDSLSLKEEDLVKAYRALSTEDKNVVELLIKHFANKKGDKNDNIWE